MTHIQCPLCRKYSSVGLYDPSNFEDDILIVKFRGLGRGKGFEIADKYSLLDGSDPELLELISERVAVIYDMLFEDVEDDDEAEAEEEEDEVDFESLSELDKELILGEEDEEAEEESPVDLENEDEDINDLDENIVE